MALTEDSIRGLDVSDWNGHINWNAVARAGYRFAFTKCDQGDYLYHKTYDYNFQGAKTAGLYVGAYHFLDPNIPAKRSAEHFLRKVWRLSPGDFGPALDFEELYGVAPSVALGNAEEWCDRVEQKLGRDAIVYTYPDFAQNIMENDLGALTHRALWWARYDRGPAPLYGGWSLVSFWQYTSAGVIPGAGQKGRALYNVDLNYWNGEEPGLRRMAGYE